jgi:hypothetical protein
LTTDYPWPRTRKFHEEHYLSNSIFSKTSASNCCLGSRPERSRVVPKAATTVDGLRASSEPRVPRIDACAVRIRCEWTLGSRVAAAISSIQLRTFGDLGVEHLAAWRRKDLTKGVGKPQEERNQSLGRPVSTRAQVLAITTQQLHRERHLGTEPQSIGNHAQRTRLNTREVQFLRCSCAIYCNTRHRRSGSLESIAHRRLSHNGRIQLRTSQLSKAVVGHQVQGTDSDTIVRYIKLGPSVRYTKLATRH